MENTITLFGFAIEVAMIVLMYRQLSDMNRTVGNINHNLLNFRSAVKDYIEAQAEVDHNRDILLSHIRNNGKALLDLFAKLANKPAKGAGEAKKPYNNGKKKHQES